MIDQPNPKRLSEIYKEENPILEDYRSRLTSQMTVNLINSMGDDLTVVNAARVSMDKESEGAYDNEWNWYLPEADRKLISYLAKNQHWTPFGHVIMQLRISCPVFVARQWTRSNVGTVRNEVSRRYVDKSPTYYLPRELHARPEKSIKQGSGEVHTDSDFWLKALEEVYQRNDALYASMVKAGIAPEEARMVLPLSHFTEFYETGSLAYFARILKLRLDGHTQGATRDLADLVYNAIINVAPISLKALMHG